MTAEILSFETGRPAELADDEPALVVDVEQTRPMPLVGSFCCGPNELLALVGPSGAGKTSMLRVLAGLMRPERGCVAVGGEVWCDTAQGVFLPPQRRNVGLVFQNYALMPHLSALDNVALSLLHLPRNESMTIARHWLDHVRMTSEQQARRPATLSGGEQQRVAVARALAREPRLLLLDEPTASLDHANGHLVVDLLSAYRERGTVVVVTHDPEMLQGADAVLMMRDGQSMGWRDPAEVLGAGPSKTVAL